MPEYALREGRGRFSLRRFPGGWSVALTLPLFFFFVLPFLRLFWLSADEKEHSAFTEKERKMAYFSRRYYS